MPVFFQHQVNEFTRLGVWKIEETEQFFRGNVPVHRDVTHPHKRLQHLAGRFLLQYMYADFPYELIRIADTRKPFLPDERYHFSISHCGDYAAAIVSSRNRVGVDVEIPTEKVLKLSGKFLSERECSMFNVQCSMFDTGTPLPKEILRTPDTGLPTLLWSCKEAVFKWHGNGAVDFRKHIQLFHQQEGKDTVDCFFEKTGNELVVHYRVFESLVLAWVVS
ncbi:MAG: 4'-phosphopantetheinyl transferase family protein [Chitinophagaceae bacterium]